jgi:predicted dehydrogenase
MGNLRFAIFGTGFWSNYQIPGWLEGGGCECVAAYNRTVSKAEVVAKKFGIPRVYASPEELLDKEEIDFLDVCTDVDTHPKFVHMAAGRKIPVVCQKPMAPTPGQAEGMVQACRDAGVPFYVNENFRWQTPMRQLKKVLDSGAIGTPFRARVDMVSGFPVFENQPFLAELEQFVITDVGSHTLDVTRFLFGEARSLFCRTQKIHPAIKGEDVATIMLEMDSGVTALVEMGYAENYLEHDKFPETQVFVEGSEGSVLLDLDFWVRVTTKDGTHARRYPPPKYDWIDPEYAIVHSSIAACQENLLGALAGTGEAETTGDDNLKTVRLVFSSYESAARGQVVRL